MPFRFGTQPRRFPVEGGDSSIGLEPGLSSSATCNGKEMSPTRQLRRCPGSHCLTITDVPRAITVYVCIVAPCPAGSSTGIFVFNGYSGYTSHLFCIEYQALNRMHTNIV
ncbi:protein FAM229B-like [Bos javanicus]|uniref:protein FAM229B-like n=1 Tax=Bos javanicus TaxID=9906 RepID=UPI002AA7498A|nr:protein FAM229B-like [Bos javanicus]